MSAPPNNPFLQSVPLSIPAVLPPSRPISDGEPINAAVTNRLPVNTAGNMAIIHDLIKRFRDLSGEYLWQMPIAADVTVGDFVYFDPHAHAFKKGLARFTVDGEQVYESDTSLVWGVVINIRDDKADICTNGLCGFRPTSDAYSRLCTPGIRFLSNTEYGRLSDEAKCPCKCVGFLVGMKPSGEVQFFVRPYLSVDTRVHQHRLYSLVTAPSDDLTIPGWLSAGHHVFNGTAPTGAVYAYNPHFLTGCG